jgi:phosphoribosyl 1,2-cyclic phosphate phosphodiesterase
LLVQRGSAENVTSVIVDTSPDLREQMIDAEVRWLDGVLFTHDHADHTHGIDDLRPFFIHQRRRVDIYVDATTSAVLNQRFGYCFSTPVGGEYPPILTEHRIAAGEAVTITGKGGSIVAAPFEQIHGGGRSLGFRFDRLAYSCDVSGIPEESLAELRNLDVWVVDALRHRPHPSHFSLDEALSWIEKVRPRRAVLTNLHTDLDYETLRRSLPDSVEPAFDGMRITLDG